MKVWSWRNAIQRAQLAPFTKLVLLNLSVYMNDLGESCYPTTSQQAADTGMSERSVCTHLQLATDAGFLAKSVHGFGGQGWKRNEYSAVMPPGFEIGKGTERGSARSAKNKPEQNGAKNPEGTERGSAPSDKKALNLTTKGTEPDDKKALKEVQCNSPEELSNKLLRENPVDNFRIENLLSDAGRDKARQKAPGWDLHFLMRLFDQKVLLGEFQKPNHPDRAFPAWCHSYTKGRRP